HVVAVKVENAVVVLAVKVDVKNVSGCCESRCARQGASLAVASH
ncbi:hypothetical protein A2U01_0065573, partial [Trifolium medium]|nr:hypothetical protein [Trifolium medium]